jgi:hypothetical protein
MSIALFFVGVFILLSLAITMLYAKWCWNNWLNSKAIKKDEVEYRHELRNRRRMDDALDTIQRNYIEPFDICPLWSPETGCDSSCPTCRGTGVMFTTIDPL